MEAQYYDNCVMCYRTFVHTGDLCVYCASDSILVSKTPRFDATIGLIIDIFGMFGVPMNDTHFSYSIMQVHRHLSTRPTRRKET